MLVKIMVYYKEWKTVLKKKACGRWNMDSNFDLILDDSIFLPKGVWCSVEVHVFESSACYKTLAKPAKMDFSSPDGVKLLDNIRFVVSGEGEKVPKVCLVSKLFLNVVDEDCIILED